MLDERTIDFETLYPAPYKIIENELYCEVYKNDVTITKKLCNFVPYIVEEVIIDDGLEITRSISLSGIYSSGEKLKTITISASELTSASMNWVIEKWGSICNIEPGRLGKDSIRHAIQTTACNAKVKTTYKYFGWKKINNSWEFLMNGKQLNIDAGRKFENYFLYNKNPEVTIGSSLDFINSKFTSDKCAYALLAYTYLTPLNHFLKEVGYEPRMVLFLVGRTGTMKSTLAALTLSHFGYFSSVDLPLSFKDTANSIISSSYVLKDVLTVIDDFHPATRIEEKEMLATAQTVIRAYGNRSGRSRLTSDSKPIDAKAPRGNAIITGEQAPDIAESVTARTIQLELKENDVALDQLSNMQTKAQKGYLSSAMEHYLNYIKTDKIGNLFKEKNFLKELHRDFSNYRNRYTELLNQRQIKYHSRMPESAAWLNIGLKYSMDFFKAYNKITEEEYQHHLAKGEVLFLSLITEQSEKTEKEKPSKIFVSKFKSLLNSGKAIVLSKASSENDMKPVGFIGYEDELFYYLNTEIVYSMVKKLCFEQEEYFPISRNALLNHLYDEGYIEGSESMKTKVIRIGDKTQRLMWVRKERIEGCSN